MKTIISKTYIEAQMVNLQYDPKRLKGNPQGNAQVRSFIQAFKTLGINNIAALNEADAVALNEVQTLIRQKLKSFGVRVSL